MDSVLLSFRSQGGIQTPNRMKKVIIVHTTLERSPHVSHSSHRMRCAATTALAQPCPSASALNPAHRTRRCGHTCRCCCVWLMPEAAPASHFARHITSLTAVSSNSQADDLRMHEAQKPRTPLTPFQQNQSRSPKPSPPVRPFLLGCVLSGLRRRRSD